MKNSNTKSFINLKFLVSSMLREFVARKYKQVAKLIKPGSSVLDIGCNTGELLDVLPKADYVGVDINK